MNKDELRLKCKQIRKTLDIKTISADICAQIRDSKLYKSANNVMIFYSKAEEVDLTDLLNDSKTFFLPRVCGKSLEICPYKKGDELKLSSFGVLEPTCKPVDLHNVDLLFIPALATDINGFRLGYGGGFYDRLLKECDCPKTAIVIPKQLIFNELPLETFDQQANCVFSA